MSAHVSRNLKNYQGKGDKMQGLPTFNNPIATFLTISYNTVAQMSSSIYNMTFKVVSNRVMCGKIRVCISFSKYVNHYCFINFNAWRYCDVTLYVNITYI